MIDWQHERVFKIAKPNWLRSDVMASFNWIEKCFDDINNIAKLICIETAHQEILKSEIWIRFQMWRLATHYYFNIPNRKIWKQSELFALLIDLKVSHLVIMLFSFKDGLIFKSEQLIAHDGVFLWKYNRIEITEQNSWLNMNMNIIIQWNVR